ncbi:MAG: hypothetical protein M1820_010713 [Bogoriella megaspora]|nr:MAG: hypothetical protein M1820_010713 [Bogoriella megaspora]
MAGSKPIFVVFPGSFHLHDCLQPLISELQNQGYEAKSATLATTDSKGGTIEDDVNLMRSLLEPLIDQGREVVLVLHSYAGFPGSATVQGLSKSEIHGKDSDGGIIGVVYMCAFIPQEGVSLYQALGGKWLDWHVPDEENKTLWATTPEKIFYQDCPTDLTAEAVAKLKGHSIVCLTEKEPPVYYNKKHFDGRRAYIRCTEDAALLPFVQDALIEESGVQWIVKEIAAGHSPFMSKPKELAQALNELVDEFEKAP